MDSFDLTSGFFDALIVVLFAVLFFGPLAYGAFYITLIPLANVWGNRSHPYRRTWIAVLTIGWMFMLPLVAGPYWLLKNRPGTKYRRFRKPKDAA